VAAKSGSKPQTPDEMIAETDTIDYTVQPNIYHDNSWLEEADEFLPLLKDGNSRKPLLDGALARYGFWQSYYFIPKTVAEFAVEDGILQQMRDADPLRYKIRAFAMFQVAAATGDTAAADKILEMTDHHGRKIINSDLG